MSGISDIPLSDIGREQCGILSRLFANIPIDNVYASPLQRAQESARLIFPQHSDSIQVDQSLIEISYGDYEGFRIAEYKESESDVIGQWITAPSELSFPGGGNIRQHAQNAYLGLFELAQKNSNKKIACVSHRTTIRLIVAKTMGLDLNNFRLIPCSNCSITELTFEDGKFMLLSVNISAELLNEFVFTNKDNHR